MRMTKQQFLDALRKGLSQLPEEEIRKQQAYYSEIIDDMVEDGMTEQEAVSRLGSVQEIYENILLDTPLPLLVKTKTRPKGGWTALTFVLVILGFPVWFPIAAALFAVVLSVYAVIWTLVIVAFAVVLAIILGAVMFGIFFVRLLFTSLSAALLALGFALGLAGVALLAGFIAVGCCKLIIRATAAIGRGIKSLFIRKEG